MLRSSLILFLLTSSFFVLQAQPKQFKLLTYGFPDMSMWNAKQVVAQRWGIIFVPVAGCLVSDELIRKTKIHNDSVELLLSEKYGKDWQQKFDQALEAEDVLQTKMIYFIENNKFIRNKMDNWEKGYSDFEYDFTALQKVGFYIVKIQARTLSEENRDESKTLLKLNYLKKTIEVMK